MAFSPQIIATGDYPSIRRALGLDGSDTTNVPDELIEDRSFLPATERAVRTAVTTWSEIIDNGDPDYDADRHARLEDGVVYGAAGRLAALWMARRAGEELKSARLGEQSLTWRDPREWMEVAADLASKATAAIAAVLYWGEDTAVVTLAKAAGPTRKASSALDVLTESEIEALLTPDVVKGTTY